MQRSTEDAATLEIWLVSLSAAHAAIDAHWHSQQNAEAAAAVTATAHRALRLLLARYVGMAAACAPFAIGPQGKPRLAGAAGPEFSLTHSGDFALVGISTAGAIGVDIEIVRPLRMTAERRQQIIAAAIAVAGRPLPERATGDGTGSAGSDAAGIQAWVRLEAVAKATGEGMGRLLTRQGIIGARAPSSSGLVASIPVVDLSLPAPLAGAVAGPGARAVEARGFPTEADALQRLLVTRRPRQTLP